MEWRVVLQNKSTQARELLSIEMPQQSQRMFQLKTPMPSFERPIRINPGGTHTQGIKFTSRGVGHQGTFRHSLIFNFSNWVLEHELSVTVAAPDTVSDMQILKPVSVYVPKPLPENEPDRVLVPAFPPNRVCTLPGVNLYTATLEHAGPNKPDVYKLPPNIVDIVEGAIDALFGAGRGRGQGLGLGVWGGPSRGFWLLVHASIGCEMHSILGLFVLSQSRI